MKAAEGGSRGVEQKQIMHVAKHNFIFFTLLDVFWGSL